MTITSEENFYSPFKIGLLAVIIAFFMFTLYSLITVEWIGEWEGLDPYTSYWIFITDISSFVGLISRFIGSLIAVVAYCYYFVSKDLSTKIADRVLKIVLIAEAIYWFTFITSGIWGFTPIFDAILDNPSNIGGISFILSTGIPCMFEAIFLPISLIKIVTHLGTNKPKTGVIKWGLIGGTGYIFVWWLNNMGLWINTIIIKGTEYLINYPINMISFVSTIIGLLALGIIAIIFSKKSIGTKQVESLNLKIVGAIIVFGGLYFLWNYIGGIMYGKELWSVWYAWLLGHNLDLWALSLPLLGLPLLFKNDS